MTLARPLIATLMILGLSSAGFAGDLHDSIANAAQQQSQEKAPAGKIPKPYAISGATLFVVGMSMTLYGFLHTSGGDFVSGAVSKESKTGLGAAGLAVAGAGGAVLFMGVKRAPHAPSIAVGPHGVTISKRVAW
jgi:hypothetical protein